MAHEVLFNPDKERIECWLLYNIYIDVKKYKVEAITAIRGQKKTPQRESFP
jgi:hypothetical protein